MSIPASASMAYPQYGAGAQAYMPASYPAAPAYIPAPAAFAPSAAFAPASATPCAQPASVTYVPAPVAMQPALAPVYAQPAPAQPAPAPVYAQPVQPEPAPVVVQPVQPAPAPVVEPAPVQPAPAPATPGVAQVTIKRTTVDRPDEMGVQAQRQIVGGAAEPTTESPEMVQAEREVMVFEKFVVQAEREAGLPDTIHTTTMPYNVDLVMEEEREELDVVMLLIFGVSFIGVGGVAFMLTQQMEADKQADKQSDKQSEQAVLQQQMRQQQSWQEQQRRLNSQRRPSQNSQGQAAQPAAAQPAQEAVPSQQPTF